MACRSGLSSNETPDPATATLRHALHQPGNLLRELRTRKQKAMAGLVLVLLATTIGLALAAPASRRGTSTSWSCARTEPPPVPGGDPGPARAPAGPVNLGLHRRRPGPQRAAIQSPSVAGAGRGTSPGAVRSSVCTSAMIWSESGTPTGLVNWDGRGHWPLSLVVTTSVALLLALAVTVVLLCRALDAATGEGDRPR